MACLALSMQMNISASRTWQFKLWRIHWRIAKDAPYADSKIQTPKKAQTKSKAKVKFMMENDK